MADDPDFLFAATVMDGREAIALFNYNAEARVSAKVTHPTGGVWRAVDAVTGKTVAERSELGAGLDVEIPVEGVRIIIFETKGTR